MTVSNRTLLATLFAGILTSSASAQVSAVSQGPSLPAVQSWPFVVNQMSNPTPFCQDPFRFFLGAGNQNLEAVANIKFSNAADSMSSYGMQIEGETLGDKGYTLGLSTNTNVDNYAGQKGRATAYLAQSGGYFASGNVLGSRGSAFAETLRTFDSTGTSRALGGYFQGGHFGTDPLPSFTGGGTFWVGGTMGELCGTLNQALSQGAYAAVIGLDKSDPASLADTYAGYFGGDVRITGDVAAASFTVASSRRWKEDIETLQDPMELLNELRGVRYTWKETGDDHIGFIAEEVAEVCPEIVTFDADGSTARGVEYSRITAVLVEAVQDQQTEIEELRAMVRELLEAQDQQGQ